jgi:predicted anti-sigma-YlaC factor YlaD
MNCKDIEILLQLAADNEATEAELTAIDAHLDACLICRRKEAWLELLNERFGEVLNPSIEDSPGLADAVVDALNASQLAEDPK